MFRHQYREFSELERLQNYLTPVQNLNHWFKSSWIFTFKSVTQDLNWRLIVQWPRLTFIIFGHRTFKKRKEEKLKIQEQPTTLQGPLQLQPQTTEWTYWIGVEWTMFLIFLSHLPGSDFDFVVSTTSKIYSISWLKRMGIQICFYQNISSGPLDFTAKIVLDLN